MATTAAGGVQGVLGLVIQEIPTGWSVESTRFHGSNVVSFEAVSGGHRTLLIRAYLPLGVGPGPL